MHLAFGVCHTLCLSLQGKVACLHQLLPYLISFLLAWILRHVYPGLDLLLAFAHLGWFVVAWRLLVFVAVAALDLGLMLCCSVVQEGVSLHRVLVWWEVVVLWVLLVALGVAVLVACVIGLDLVRMAWWIVEILVARGAL